MILSPLDVAPARLHSSLAKFVNQCGNPSVQPYCTVHDSRNTPCSPPLKTSHFFLPEWSAPSSPSTYLPFMSQNKPNFSAVFLDLPILPDATLCKFLRHPEHISRTASATGSHSGVITSLAAAPGSIVPKDRDCSPGGSQLHLKTFRQNPQASF